MKLITLNSFAVISAFSLAIITLSGCTDRFDPTVVNTNKATLSSDGEYIGKLKDNRKIIRYRIDMGSNHPHFIYVVDSGEITVNTQVPTGKTTRTETVAIIP